jgi:hypothetical protein
VEKQIARNFGVGDRMLTYPFSQDAKFQIFKLMREVLGRAIEYGQLIFSPLKGEHDLVEVAVRLLAEHNLIAYEWNPIDPKSKGHVECRLIGDVYIACMMGRMLQIFDNEHSIPAAKEEIH